MGGSWSCCSLLAALALFGAVPVARPEILVEFVLKLWGLLWDFRRFFVLQRVNFRMGTHRLLLPWFGVQRRYACTQLLCVSPLSKGCGSPWSGDGGYLLFPTSGRSIGEDPR